LPANGRDIRNAGDAAERGAQLGERARQLARQGRGIDQLRERKLERAVLQLRRLLLRDRPVLFVFERRLLLREPKELVEGQSPSRDRHVPRPPRASWGILARARGQGDAAEAGPE